MTHRKVGRSDEVAEWYERANLIGIISTPKTSYIFRQFDSVKFNSNGYSVPLFIEYNIPCNDGSEPSLFCYNWPGFLETSFKNSKSNGKKSNARSHMEKLFSMQDEIGNAVFSKYEETLKFVDLSISNLKKAD